MKINEKQLKKIVNESVNKVLNERKTLQQTEKVFDFFLTKELVNTIKMGNEPDAVLMNYLFEELMNNGYIDCIHFISKMIIEKIRGEM